MRERECDAAGGVAWRACGGGSSSSVMIVSSSHAPGTSPGKSVAGRPEISWMRSFLSLGSARARMASASGLRSVMGLAESAKLSSLQRAPLSVASERSGAMSSILFAPKSSSFGLPEEQTHVAIVVAGEGRGKARGGSCAVG